MENDFVMAIGPLAAIGIGGLAKLGRKVAGKLVGKAKGAVGQAIKNKFVRRGAKAAAGAAATGAVFEVGSRAVRRGDGEPRFYRRMNPANPKALRKAIRRVDRAKDMFGKVLSATKASSHSGWKIRPKGTKRRG